MTSGSNGFTDRVRYQWRIVTFAKNRIKIKQKLDRRGGARIQVSLAPIDIMKTGRVGVGGVKETRGQSPNGPISFISMQCLVNFWPINRLARPPLEFASFSEILDPPLNLLIIKTLGLKDIYLRHKDR